MWLGRESSRRRCECCDLPLNKRPDRCRKICLAHLANQGELAGTQAWCNVEGILCSARTLDFHANKPPNYLKPANPLTMKRLGLRDRIEQKYTSGLGQNKARFWASFLSPSIHIQNISSIPVVIIAKALAVGRKEE